MSENLFGLTVAADKGLDDLQCQRLLSENRRYQEVMLQYRCALKALESRLEILNKEFSLLASKSDLYNLHLHHSVTDPGEKTEKAADGRVFQIVVAQHIAPAGHLQAAIPRADFLGGI